MFWESCEKFGRKLWDSFEKVFKKFWESFEKVARKLWEVVTKLWESCGKVVRKLWESSDKVVRKLWESCENVAELSRHLCSRVLSGNLSELKRRLHDHGFAFQGKGHGKNVRQGDRQTQRGTSQLIDLISVGAREANRQRIFRLFHF